MKVGAVVLAAGKSERMGQNKLLMQLNGKSIVEGILDALEAAGIGEQVIVLGTEPQKVAEVIRSRLGRLKIALNLAPEQGMTSSFQTGLTVISGVDAAFLVLGDEAILNPDLLKTMVETMENNAASLIVSPVHNGKKGHPLLFRRELFGEILSLTGEQTMREIVHGHADRLDVVEAPEWTTMDIDTPEDYEQLIDLVKKKRLG